MYLDGLLICSRTLTEHLSTLRWVFEKLRASGFKAKREKCVFKTELKFLGHIVSRNGLAPDPAKVQTVVEWPTPCSRFEVRSFLELANYFSRFIKDYAKLAKPLTALLKGICAAHKRGRLLQRGELSQAESERMKADVYTVWTPSCAFSLSKSQTCTANCPCVGTARL